jgi:DNA primase
LISEDVIQKVKEQNNIVDIISEKVKLKRAGRNYTGLCPFHNEKTPSFSVSPEKQIYKCFGCGEVGNVITFVMKTQNTSFPEAIKTLADRANIEFENDATHTRNDSYDKIYKINIEAAKYYYSNLFNKKNDIALTYFLDRGITQKTVKNFGLGYSPDDWRSLLNYLKSRKYSEIDMLNAGLIIKGKNSSLYDRFRNRVMFPVFDYRGRIIGFGGRVMDDSKPKYLNSPETSVFKKGTNLYGLNFALKDGSRSFIIVEGYMDCISLHQYGIKNAVASLGTALTSMQAKLLRRYADKVIISYDADTAGKAATIRGMQVLKDEGFDVRVLTVLQGKDPDEFIRSNGKEAFLALIEGALPLTDYKIKRAEDGFNLKNHEDVIKYTEKTLEIISELDSIEMDIYIKRLSEKTGIKDQALYDIINEKMKNNVKNYNSMNNEVDFGQKLYVEPSYIKAGRALLKLMLIDDSVLQYANEKIKCELFLLDSHRKIFDFIIDNINCPKSQLQNKVESKCVDLDTNKELIAITNTDVIYNKDDFIALIQDHIFTIEKSKLEMLKKNIMTKIKSYELEGNSEESIKLAQELIRLQKKLDVIQ